MVPVVVTIFDMCEAELVEINLWSEPGTKRSVGGVRGGGRDATALRAALRQARDDASSGDEVLWSQPRINAGVRAAARIVLGFGSTVVVGLLLAIAVVGAETRTGLLAVLAAVLVIGGGFVGVVWAVDVGIDVHADGRLVRSGWGGIDTVDLRSYRRVTVKETRSDGDGVGAIDFGGD